MGYLPEALRNYLLRLGWAHGDDEIISTEQAVEWFSLEAVGKGAARFDFAKLDHLNGHYLRQADPARLVALVGARLEGMLGRPLDQAGRTRLAAGMTGLSARAVNLKELAENAAFYVRETPLPFTDKARTLLAPDAVALLGRLRAELAGVQDWSEAGLEDSIRIFAGREGVKLGQVAQPLRAVLTGSTTSPGIFDVMAVLGPDECLRRLAPQTQQSESSG